MSADPFTATDRNVPASAIARAGDAERRTEARLATAIADIFLPVRDRLDERTRVAITTLIDTDVAALEREIAGHAARLLSDTDVAGRLVSNAGGALARLIDSGLLRDGDLMGEWIGQARIDLIDAALIANRAPGRAPNLMIRLAESGDGVIRGRAIAYLVADGRRRLPATQRRAELPVDLYRRLAWWIAATVRERIDAGGDDAVAEATQRSIAAHDEDARVESTAARLAVAIDARPAEQAPLLIDTLTEGRLVLFCAMLAHALGVDGDEARELVLDTQGDRLWLALRALGLDRDAIARIGWLLSEADRARDVEALADAIDPIAAMSPDDAGQALAPLMLARDFRRAVRALARGVS